jgi:hypothetical protein
MDPELAPLLRELYSRALELRDAMHATESVRAIAIRGFTDLHLRLSDLDHDRGGTGLDASILQLVAGERPPKPEHAR